MHFPASHEANQSRTIIKRACAAPITSNMHAIPDRWATMGPADIAVQSAATAGLVTQLTAAAGVQWCLLNAAMATPACGRRHACEGVAHNHTCTAQCSEGKARGDSHSAVHGGDASSTADVQQPCMMALAMEA